MEPDLFRAWGGKPTTLLLRFNGPTSTTLQGHRHVKLQNIVGDTLHIPNAVEESAAPDAADEAYDAAVAVLRARTRREGFDLVFKENCNYGFRRNLLGLRRTGVILSCLGLVLSLAGLVVGAARLPSLGTAPFVVSILVDLGLLGFWLRVVSSGWVKSQAYDYANRLLEAIETLDA